MISSKTKYSYDKENDILYIAVADNSEEYGAEEIDFITVFRDLNTDNLTGFMIMNFRQKLSSGFPIRLPYGHNLDINEIIKTCAI